MNADTDLYPLQEVMPGSFIYAIDNALSLAECDEIVKCFEANPAQQYQGRIGEASQQQSSIKQSTDLHISAWDDWQSTQQLFQQSLKKAVNSMAALHPFFRNSGFHDDGVNLQRTLPGEFYRWHVDYGWGKKLSQRALVAIWYLNDVPGPGGTTDFEFQNLAIQPQAGRLVLFPPYWTHVHRNSTLQAGVKYIATTWLSMDAEPA